MSPDYSDPTDPRAIALRFANPSYSPEWSPEDRPPWPGINPSPVFRQWCGDRLPELEALVKGEQEAAMGEALAPEHVARLADTLGSRRWIADMAKADAAIYDLTRAGKKPDIHQLTNKLKRMDEAKRRGRTRGEDSAENYASEAAASDIWMLRKVILPRFWPGDAVGEYHLANRELGKVVAFRHGGVPDFKGQALEKERTRRATKAERLYWGTGFAAK